MVTEAEAEALKDEQRAIYSSGDPTYLAALQAPMARALAAAATITSEDVVLDVGAGNGNVAMEAAATGARVAAVDLTPRQVELGRERAAMDGLEIEWQVADAEDLPFADDSFTCVVSGFGAIFAPRPERAAAEMLRVLRPGGRIAYTTHAPESLNVALGPVFERFLPPEDPSDDPDWADERQVAEWFPGCDVVLETHVDRSHTFPGVEAWFDEVTDKVPFGRYMRDTLTPAQFAEFRELVLATAAPYARREPGGETSIAHHFVIGRVTPTPS